MKKKRYMCTARSETVKKMGDCSDVALMIVTATDEKQAKSLFIEAMSRVYEVNDLTDIEIKLDKKKLV